MNDTQSARKAGNRLPVTVSAMKPPGNCPSACAAKRRAGPAIVRCEYSGSRTVASDDGVTRVFSDGRSCAFTEFMQRPLRPDPYYFDMKEDITGQLTRFWFNLRK